MKTRLKTLALLLSLCMVFTVATACGYTEAAVSTTSVEESILEEETAAKKQDTVKEPMEESASSAETAEASASEVVWGTESVNGGFVPGPTSLSYPIDTDETTLSIWGSISPMISQYLDDWNDQIICQAYEQETGIHLDYTYYSPMNGDQAFNLMLAAGDWPELIQGFSGFYASGLDNAISEDIIVPLEDYMDTYAPDYWHCITANGMEEDQYTDNGHIGLIQGFENAYTGPMSGPMIRNDWLMEQGLEIPTSYDDWFEVLSVFKSAYGCSAPLLLTGATQNSNWLVGGYGVCGYTTTTMYHVGETVYTSLTQNAYKEYLIMLNEWFDAGLIGKDFFALDSSIMNADTASYVYQGESGIFYGMTTQMSTYLDGTGTSEGDIIGIPDALKDGETVMHFGGYPVARTGQSICISASCNKVEIAMQWLNYGFTEDAYWLLNYGIDGTSYTMGDDGIPIMTDEVINNPNYNVSIAMALYTWPQIPCVQDAYRNYNTIFTESQKDTWNEWSGCIDGAYELPESLSLTEIESTEYATLMSDITTYCDSAILQFVIGEKSFDEWDSFVAEVENFGINRCVEIYQAAYDRYLGR